MRPLLLLLCLATTQAFSQSTNDFLLSASTDLIKTDVKKIFGKAQAGLEVNFFVQRHFAVSAGAELWTNSPNSFMLGVRWYKNDNLFFRFRGLIGVGDAAIGAGYSKPIARNWRLEGMADLYFSKPDFALRGGIAYVINYVKKPIRTGPN